MGCPVSPPAHDFDPDSGIDTVSNVLKGGQDPSSQATVGVILVQLVTGTLPEESD